MRGGERKAKGYREERRERKRERGDRKRKKTEEKDKEASINKKSTQNEIWRTCLHDETERVHAIGPDVDDVRVTQEVHDPHLAAELIEHVLALGLVLAITEQEELR